MNNKIILGLAVCLLSWSVVGCSQKENEIPTPKLTFTEIVDADFESVTLYCTVSGNVTVNHLSVEYSKDQALAGALKKAFDKKGDGFIITISGLEIQSKYYYRYCVENKASTFSDEKIREFKTLDFIPPVVSTGGAKDISGTRATLDGTIEFACGKEILEKGFFIGTNQNNLEAKPTTGSTLTLSIEGLEYETTYYYQAYAKTEIGTGKGEIKEFKTSNAVSFNALTIQDITATSVLAKSGIADNGGIEIEKQGFRYSEGTSEEYIFVESTGETNIVSLKPATPYKIWYYAKTFEGEFESEKTEFETKDGIVVLTTSSTENVTTTTALLKGLISSDGGSAITERGFCYGQSEMPTVSNTRVIVAGTTGEYQSNLTSLPQNKTYYVRAYAINAIGTYYGDQVSFTTLYDSVIFGTTSCSNVTASSASLKGSITSNGGSTVTKCGFCFSTSANPTVNDQLVEVTDSKTNLVATIKNLNSGVTYHVRAFATNTNSTFYSNEITFVTEDGKIQLATPELNNIAAESVVASSSIISAGGGTISERGFCYGLTKNPTTSNSVVKTLGTTGEYSCTISGLKNKTVYYIRAYGTNESGTYYSSEVTITTLSGIASLTTEEATNIMATTATINGTIISDGGSNITERGFCYGTSEKPTTNSSKVIIEGTIGDITKDLTALDRNTKYYFRTYAINGYGTHYGNEASFTTYSGLADVETLSASTIKAQSATVTGKVNSENGSTITERGFCYATTNNPSIQDTKIVIDGLVGEMSTSLTSLTPNTMYYVKAFASTVFGTSYGEVKSFTTPNGVVSFSNMMVSNVLATGFAAHADISDDGGCEVSEYGFCYSTDGTPTISSPFVKVGMSGTVIDYSFNNLLRNTNYSVRAYAKNALGVYYSDIKQVLTETGAASLSSLSVSDIKQTTAKASITVSDDGGAEIQRRGFCFSTSTAPTINSSIIVVEGTVGAMSSIITGLLSDTDYHIRAFASTVHETVYSNEVQIHTIAGLASLATTTISNIQPTSASLQSYLLATGGVNVTELGFCYGTNSNPTISDNCITTQSIALGEYSIQLSGLEQNTKYYVRAYAKTEYGVAYGEQAFFTTTYNPVEFSNLTVSNVLLRWAHLSGTIVSDGGNTITERGFLIGTKQDFNQAEYVYPIGGNGNSLVLDVKNLEQNTDYYAFIYAKNKIGTFASNYIHFKTLELPIGAAPGIFKLEDGMGDVIGYVFVSKGNLEWKESVNTWHFAECQYETTAGYEDTFKWVSDKDGNTRIAYDYEASCNWGQYAIDNGGNTENLWKTPSRREIDLLTHHYALSNSVQKVTINGDITGVIVLPHDWTCPEALSDYFEGRKFLTSTFTMDQWTILEASGAILFHGEKQEFEYGPPIYSSYRFGSGGIGVGYWSSSTRYLDSHGADCYYPEVCLPASTQTPLCATKGTYKFYVRLVKSVVIE